VHRAFGAGHCQENCLLQALVTIYTTSPLDDVRLCQSPSFLQARPYEIPNRRMT